MKPILIAVLLIAALATPAYAATVTQCGQLNDSDTYTLANNISATGTCLTLNSSIVLDCNGFAIKYSQTAVGYGINAPNVQNITIRNCRVTDDGSAQSNAHGAYLASTLNVTLRDTRITVSGDSANGINGPNNRELRIINATVSTVDVGTAKIGIYVSNNTNPVIRNCTISTNGDDEGNNGIALGQGSNNATVSGNTIRTNGTADNYGFDLVSIANTTLSDNIIITGGTMDNYGISCNNANGTLAINNSISTHGTEGSNHGIFLTSCISASIINNSISSGENQSNNHGIHITGGLYHMVSGNHVTTSGETSNEGIHIVSSSSNTVINNTVTSNGTDASNTGIVISTDSDNMTVSDNHVLANNGYGIVIGSAEDNTANNNVIRTTGASNYGIAISGSFGNVLSGNNITTEGSGSHGIAFISAGTNDTVFNNTLLTSPTQWIFSEINTNNTFFNTTFLRNNNKLRISGRFNLTWSDVTVTKLSISANSVFVNASNLSFLNVSSRIKQPGNFVSPSLQYDPTDTGTFITCPESICTLISNVGGIVTFDVAHFTNFSVSEGFAAPAPEFGTWVMMLVALGLVAGGILRVRNKQARP